VLWFMFIVWRVGERGKRMYLKLNFKLLIFGVKLNLNPQLGKNFCIVCNQKIHYRVHNSP